MLLIFLTKKGISESDNVVSTNYSRGEKRKHASLMTLNTGCGKYNKDRKSVV